MREPDCAAGGGTPTEPRGSWIIRAGPRDGREREVCRSDQRAPCTIEAGTADRPVIAAASVFLFPVANEKTSYRGAFLANFLSTRESKVDYDVDAGRLPTGMAIAGRVLATPGQYEFRIALFAEVAGHQDPHQYEAIVPVRIVAAAGASRGN